KIGSRTYQVRLEPLADAPIHRESSGRALDTTRPDAMEQRSGEIRASEVRTRERCTREVCRGEVDIDEIGEVEHRTSEFCAAEICFVTDQVTVDKLPVDGQRSRVPGDAARRHVDEARTREVRLKEVRGGESCHVEHGSGEIRPCKVRVGEVRRFEGST